MTERLPTDHSLFTARPHFHFLLTTTWVATIFGVVSLAHSQPIVFGPYGSGGTYNAYQPLTKGLDWETARLEAACRSYFGVTGHLATIQSAQENAHVASVGGAGDVWIGLTDNEAFGGFEESGPVCCGGNGISQTGAGFVWLTGEFKSYQNWYSGEPNNYLPGEDAVHILSDGTWNDNGAGATYGQASPLFKSVIEYDLNASLSFVQARAWRIEVHKASSGVSITDLATADAVIAGIGRDYSVVSYYTHANMEDSGGAGDFGNNPGVVGVRDADDFAVQGTGYLIVQPGQEGIYVFRGNSDDGQRLRIDLNHDGNFNGPGENVIVDDVLAPPHNVDSAPITLAAGAYRIEWTWFERSGGAEGELSASRNGGPFIVLGNDEGGGLDVTQYPPILGNGPAAPPGFVSFPPAGIDSIPTTSPFSVTVNGVTYVANVTDPGTIVARSSVNTEGAEGALAVPTIGCPACSPTVSDANVGCFPPGLGDPATRREIHTEMLSLGMCGRTANGAVVCYLAGQPAANALAGRLPGQANYRNSFGEMVSKDPTGSPALDFPAVSFWAIRGVVTIFPAPPGTSGVFFSKDPVLMVLDPITTLPPPGDAFYHNLQGVTNEAGGLVCGALPAALYDAGPIGGPAAPNVPVGQVNCGNVHQIRPQPDTFKWEQVPDLTNGLDVRATMPKILADDFRCTLTGPITDIHIWGSWLSNRFDPNARFCIGIWTDETNFITGVSHPGTLLWSNWFNPCEYQSYLYASNANEQFYDPNINQIIGPDSDVWYYSFYPTNPCWQVQGTIYWLSVTAQTSSTNFLFGWKTCPTNFQDDAVFGHVDLAGNPLQDWLDMHYPLGHPYGTNRSIDLAFRISTPSGGGGPPPPPPPPPVCTRTNCLPPANKNYRAANLDPAHQQYGNLILQHLEHHRFTAWDTPPPTNGGTKVHTFGSTVSGLISLDGGATFSEISMPAAVRVRTTHDHMEGDMQVLRGEIEALDITNNSPPLRIRESPTLLSAGVTTLQPIPAGYAISSFFNVWTELSLDGGASWIPSSVAGQMQLVESNAPPANTISELAPPPRASFCEPPPDINWPVAFGTNIFIRNIWHSDLPNLIVPPTIGQSAIYSANQTLVEADVSLDRGQSYQHITAPASVSVKMRHTIDAGSTRYFQTEMSALAISGGGLPFNVRMRESPSLPSTGEHIIRSVPGGFTAVSYFDVSLEMSLDCGETWIPASRPVHLDLAIPDIVITSVTRNGSSLLINWAGGKPPYQLQRKASLNPLITWENVGNPTSLNTAIDSTTNRASFYRIQGN